MIPVAGTLSPQSLSHGARALFPAAVAVGVAGVGEGRAADLMTEEITALGSMAPNRAAEFIAGRLALRRAQRSLSVPCLAVPNAADRSPQWPAGFCGSISHACGLAIAVLAHRSDRVQSLGVDIEDDAALPADLHDIVLVPEERAALAGKESANRQAKIIFAAKEAVYKAQYLLTRRLFGFEMITVSVQPQAGCFGARFNSGIAPFRSGEHVAGRYSVCGGLIIAGLVLGAMRD